MVKLFGVSILSWIIFTISVSLFITGIGCTLAYPFMMHEPQSQWIYLLAWWYWLLAGIVGCLIFIAYFKFVDRRS